MTDTPSPDDYKVVLFRPRQDFGNPMQDQTEPLNGGGGGGTYEGMTWQEAVRRVDDKVDGNFKWTVGVFGAGFMTLLLAFASGFLFLSTKIDDGNTRVIAKLDAISAQLGDVKTEVAVLKVTAPSKRP